MSSNPRKQITTLLAELCAGESDAEAELVELVYEELRRVAEQMMRRERRDHTLQATAVVNEALIGLLEGDALREVDNRAYFFGIATQAMRQVLVDHARRRGANKRGGSQKRVALDSVMASFQDQSIDVLALDDALTRLAGMNERQSRVVMLRFFGGLTMREIAEQLKCSISTVEGDFRVARAWIRSQLVGSEQ